MPDDNVDHVDHDDPDDHDHDNHDDHDHGDHDVHGDYDFHGNNDDLADFSAKGGGIPPIPLGFFGQNDFLLKKHRNHRGLNHGQPAYSHQSKSHHGWVLTVMITVGDLSPADSHMEAHV